MITLLDLDAELNSSIELIVGGVEEHFVPSSGLGRIRIREHQLASNQMDLDQFAEELKNILRL